MHRKLLLPLVLLALLVPSLTAQCTVFGQSCASSGMNLICSSAPQIGTNWTIGERSAMACNGGTTNPTQVLTIYGVCFPGGIPLSAPITCRSCGGCNLYVLPALGAIRWTWPPRTQQIPIPADRNLVGATFCMQDACVEQTQGCVCTSNAIQVVIQP